MTSSNKPNPFESTKTKATGIVPPEPDSSRWYHYALRRLPLSLLISLFTLCVVLPLLMWLLIAIAHVFSD